jgi:hypothetical protein
VCASVVFLYKLKLTFSFNTPGNFGSLLRSIKNVASSVTSRTM